VLREAAELDSERLQEQGRPPLPATMPYKLRRTYHGKLLDALLGRAGGQHGNVDWATNP
jgi:hypothetical protein